MRTSQPINFNTLLDQHHDTLYWMIRKIVLVHHDAEDVLQNTWIKIYKGLPSFQGKSTLKTWMYRIAYNECMRFLKQKKPNFSLDEVDTDYLDFLASDRYFNAQKATHLLHSALATLSERERHVFSFKYFDALKFNAIARIMEHNENSVKTVYYKAEKKIKTYLTKHH
ncbi:MAG: RNA polymerase sigma factor [Flavobacteriaceae bacterium]